jgi:hypothetical protein
VLFGMGFDKTEMAVRSGPDGRYVDRLHDVQA